MTLPHPVRWGVLGNASINQAVLPALKTVEGATLHAIASRSLERAQQAAAHYGATTAFGDYDALLRSGEIDAVYIPLPNALHAEWTIRALQAGVSVLCEKPLALNAAQAQRVADAAKAAGRFVVEGFMYRYHAQFEFARAMLEHNEIGTLRGMRGAFTFALDDDDSVVDDAALGGGALMDVGCYPVHAMRLFAGEPVRVGAAARYAGGVDRTLSATLVFADDVIGDVETSIETDEAHHFELIGTQGRIMLPDPWVAVDTPADVVVIRDRDVVETVEVAAQNPYALQVADVTRAVATGTPPRWGVDDAVANMRALDAIAKAAREQTWVTLG